jgi:uncharacterized OB-fold protein
MVHKCIKCGKIVDSTRIYCKSCESIIKKKQDRKLEKEHLWQKADYFERQRLK